MSKANVYKNLALNETIIKFEIDIKSQTVKLAETFIILDIITPKKPKYSLVRSGLFKNIIPNLDLDTNSGIHFIYNEENEAKYFFGSNKDFKNMNIKENCYLSNDDDGNFKRITQKLKNILDTIDKEKYINILTIVNYGSEEKKYYNNSLFDEMKKKFKNIYSQILFLDCGINYNYISLTRYCKGYARKFLNIVPIYVHSYDDTEYNDYGDETIKNLISKKEIKVMNFVGEYVSKKSRSKEYDEILKEHLKWGKEFLEEPYKIIKDYYNNYEKYYEICFDKFYEKK